MTDNSQRVRGLLVEWLRAPTVQAVADRHAVSRQRISQLLRSDPEYDRVAKLHRTAIRAGRDADRAVAARDRALALLDRRCDGCDDWLLEGSAGRRFCPECRRVRGNARIKALRDKRVAAGQCCYFGCPDRATDGTMCHKHRRVTRAQARKHYQSRQRSGSPRETPYPPPQTPPD